MYGIIDSEYFISCLFFILCVVVLNFWLINLFVAVITNTFGAIRAETKKSAFGATNLTTPIAEHDDDDGWAAGAGRPAARAKANPAQLIITYTYWLFVALALASLALQATRTPTITPPQEHVLFLAELGITLAFDVEILLRLAASLPDWRGFFGFSALGGSSFGVGAGVAKAVGAGGGAGGVRKSRSGPGPGQNWLDTALAVGCSVIQVPAIRRSPLYPWFTILQLIRFYRVILVVPRMKPLLVRLIFSRSCSAPVSAPRPVPTSPSPPFLIYVSFPSHPPLLSSLMSLYANALPARRLWQHVRSRKHDPLPYPRQLHRRARQRAVPPRRPFGGKNDELWDAVQCVFGDVPGATGSLASCIRPGWLI